MKKHKKKSGQGGDVRDWINTICNIVIALAALIGLVWMIAN